MAADVEGIGRFAKDLMDEQAMMELLVASIQDTHHLQDKDGEFLDICEWDGVKIDSDGSVIEVDFDVLRGSIMMGGDIEELFFVGPGGSIDLRWLPWKVRELGIYAFFRRLPDA